MITDESGALWSCPVWVDFMHLDWNGSLRLDFPGTVQDLAARCISLSDGMKLLLYQEDADARGTIDDLVTGGIVVFDEEEGRWVALDWEPTVHASELNSRERDLYLTARSMPKT